jgi:hypothetical protein
MQGKEEAGMYRRKDEINYGEDVSKVKKIKLSRNRPWRPISL